MVAMLVVQVAQEANGKAEQEEQMGLEQALNVKAVALKSMRNYIGAGKVCSLVTRPCPLN